MTLEEALKELEDISDFDLTEDAIRRSAIRKAINALEKQIPKKVKEYYATSFSCPCCEHFVGFITDNAKDISNFCPNCGQALDWSDEEVMMNDQF